MNDFIDFLNNLLGTYSPVLNLDGSVAVGFAGVDFPYVFRALLFCIVVYSVFKLLGGIICRIF